MQGYSEIFSKIHIDKSPAYKGVKEAQRVPTKGFEQILREKVKEKELKISQHAKMRMNTRKIVLTDNQKSILNNAVEKAEQKGVKESLILMNDIAFVVSIKNKTVITAIDEDSIKGNVFTNIDGAIIV